MSTGRALDKILPQRARNFLYIQAPDGSDDWSENQWKVFARSINRIDYETCPNFGRKSLMEIERWLGERTANHWAKSPELDRLNEEIAMLKARLKARQHMKRILLDLLASPQTTSETRDSASAPGSSPSTSRR